VHEVLDLLELASHQPSSRFAEETEPHQSGLAEVGCLTAHGLEASVGLRTVGCLHRGDEAAVQSPPMCFDELRHHFRCRRRMGQQARLEDQRRLHRARLVEQQLLLMAA
jgi:hypothetical protein